MAPPNTTPRQLRVRLHLQLHSMLSATSTAGATLALALALALGVGVGCYTGPDSTLAAATAAPDASLDGARSGSRGSADPSDGEAGVGVADGLPCDVASLLASSCNRCHGAPPTRGAPMSLVTYDDLVAPWDEDPTRTIADVALERMKATQDPMPPEGPLEASAVDAFAAWVGAGTPRASCGPAKTTDDAGPPAEPVDAGPATDGGAALDTSVCTSGATWSPGSPPSALMAPGKRCLGCHWLSGGPSLTLAGTVYPTLHEPDDCAGSSSNVSVVIVDAAGKSHTLPVNGSGNFLRVTGLPMPYTARVVSGTKVREMRTPQTDGDCNGCHTELGAHSPGRIMAP